MIRHNLAYLAFLAILIVCSAFFTWRVEAFRARPPEDRGSWGTPRTEARTEALSELGNAERRQ